MLIKSEIDISGRKFLIDIIRSWYNRESHVFQIFGIRSPVARFAADFFHIIFKKKKIYIKASLSKYLSWLRVWDQNFAKHVSRDEAKIGAAAPRCLELNVKSLCRKFECLVCPIRYIHKKRKILKWSKQNNLLVFWKRYLWNIFKNSVLNCLQRKN